MWVGNNKLGSVGIAIRRGICFHGAAFNVNISLKPFDWMKPCGLQDVTVTSLEQQLSTSVSVSQVRERVRAHFDVVFGVELDAKNHAEVQEILGEEHITSACHGRGEDMYSSVRACG